jgi:hypothetical protein
VNIERIPERLMKWGVVLAGLVLAVILGQQVGNGKFGLVSMVLLGSGIFSLALAFPHRIWLAIFIVWPLSGQIPALGVPFTIKDLVIGAVFIITLGLIAFKVVRIKPKFDWLDLLVYVTLLTLITAFIRNPVGLATFDTDRVGGRPYFNIAIAFVAYWVLSRAKIDGGKSGFLARTLTQSRMTEGTLAQLLALAPVLAGIFSEYYTCSYFAWAFNPEAAPTSPGAESTGRLGYLAGIGTPLAIYALTVHRPLSCTHPIRFFRISMLGIGLACILASGFRSALAQVVLIALVSSYIYRQWRDVWRLVGIGVICLIFMVVGQGTIFKIPVSAQRALSFLPGNWDEYAVLEARESTRWRVEMWQQMLFTDKYIDSKLWGDGFGFKRRDLERIQAKRSIGLLADQEDFLVTGGVHSGPISTIRYTGYFGLMLHLLLLVGLARQGWKLIFKARGTVWQPLVFLICIPAIVEPLMFVFVFGAYDTSTGESFFLLGLMHLINNSMAEPQTKLGDVIGGIDEKIILTKT